MNKYESVIITKPIKEVGNEMTTKVSKIIENYGDVQDIEEMGIRKLAYTVKGNDEGYYIIFYFRSDSDFIPELQRQFRLEENIIKFMIIKVEGDEDVD